MLRNSNQDTQPRVAPVTPPYDAETAAALEALGPPIGIFRVFARRPDRAHGLAGGPVLPVPPVRPEPAPPGAAHPAHHRAVRRRVRVGRARPGVRGQGGPVRRAGPLGDRRAPGRPVLDRPGRPGRAPRGRRAGPRQRPGRRRLDQPGRLGRRRGRRRRPADLRLVPRDLVRRPGDPAHARAGRAAVRRLVAQPVAQPARLCSSRASARQARSKVARCRLSLLPCARVPGPPRR